MAQTPPTSQASRRDFLKTSTLAAAGAAMPYWFSTKRSLAEEAARSPNERLTIGCIGTGSRFNGGIYQQAQPLCDIVAVSDVDANHLGGTRDRVKKDQNRSEVAAFEDYRRVLDRNDIDAVTIVTPDHWHSKIAIDAMRAGKDIYCEKPLTLTIHEGKQIIKVLEETGRVFQVGTQQRTEFGQHFLRAIAMIRDGRIGKVKKATCDIGGADTSGPIPVADVPSGLNWEMWLGQAPLVEYRFIQETVDDRKRNKTRCHYEFRWWYEYSGGKLTDWGAHHVDIAQWAIGQNGPGQGPLSLEVLEVEHPVAFVNGMPLQDDRYNTATKFDVKVLFPDDVEMRIVSSSRDNNGILFEGTKSGPDGRFHVGRFGLKGKPAEDLAANPLPEGAIEEVIGGPVPKNHVVNWVDCIKSRNKPISDVWSHHKAMCTCHLAGIALRLNTKLEWDPKAEEITNNPQARAMQAREQRAGYEIDVSV